MRICVFGAASNEINNSYIENIENLGKEMAKRGHSLVFGAGGHGLMGAAARGIKSENGEIFGVIPSFFRDENIEEVFDSCTELIFTETMAQRKTKMEDLADAFIVVPGGIGTFEEFFQVLTLKQLGRHKKPIVLYDVNGYYKHLEEFLKVSVSDRFIRENCKDLYFYCDNPETALSYLENYHETNLDVHDLKLG